MQASERGEGDTCHDGSAPYVPLQRNFFFRWESRAPVLVFGERQRKKPLHTVWGFVYFCGPRQEPTTTRTNNFFTLLYSPVFPLNKTTKRTRAVDQTLFPQISPLQPSIWSRFICPSTPNHKLDTRSVRPPTRSFDSYQFCPLWLIRSFLEIRVSRRSNRVPIGSIEAEFLPGASDLCLIGGVRIWFLRYFRPIGAFVG